MKIAVVGAGYAGCAAAFEAAQAGHQVALFEAARTLGGRARRVDAAEASRTSIDNGQHILIGAYADCQRIMSVVGIDTKEYLLRMPMELCFPDDVKLTLPRWPAPLHVLAGIAYADGLTNDDKLAFLKASLSWRSMKWRCDEAMTVAQLTADLPPLVRQRFTDLLCVSALNTAPETASAQVFLTVLKDSLGAKREASDFLLPRTDLSALLPDAVANWLVKRGHRVLQGERVSEIKRVSQDVNPHPTPLPSLGEGAGQWLVNNKAFDTVIIATPALEAARLLTPLQAALPEASETITRCNALQYEPITTVYVRIARRHGSVDNKQIRLPKAMLALNETPTQPAQFVFDRGLLCGDEGMFSLIISASSASQDFTERQWLQAAREALAQWKIQGMLTIAKVITEKRATFACTAGLKRPAMKLGDTLMLAGDYVDSPYPSTLEGAVRSGVAAAHALRAPRT
jgi:squalene-associated FAD-dependent desaturase